MFLLIIFVLTLIWFAVMSFVSGRIFARSKRWRKAKVAALTLVLTVAPFAEDLYVYYGFQAYCDGHAGIVKLEPVRTDSLAFNTMMVNEYPLLANPALRHVVYTGPSRGFMIPPLSLSTDPQACLSELHQKRIHSRDPDILAMSEQVVGRGLCYSGSEPFATPRYLFRKGPLETFRYHKSQSLFFPREVRANANVELVDLETGVVKSRFVQLYTRPGFLTGIILPQMPSYSCPAIGRDRYFGMPGLESQIYKFLEKAIVSDHET